MFINICLSEILYLYLCYKKIYKMNYKEYIKSKEYVSSYEKHIQFIKDQRRIRKYNNISDFLPFQQMKLLKDMEEYNVKENC